MKDKLIGNEKNILFYNDNEGNTKVEVLLQNEDVWLSADALATLFSVKRPAITKHINNIYNDGELEENTTCSKMEHMGNGGKQTYNTKDYMIQGFALNDERFMKANKNDQEYFQRLLERIKLIRTSERMFYQKITDIFAECSIDYDKNSELAIEFYKTIQNKFHYAITGQTAAEIVYNRVDSTKENMGLTNWKKSLDGKILKSDITIAKNYLDEKELKNLNNLVNLFLDIAENNVERNITMYMEDWKKEVENALKVFHYSILEGKGTISHNQAVKKAEDEYEKYKIIQDRNYVSDFDKLMKATKQIEKSDNIT